MNMQAHIMIEGVKIETDVTPEWFGGSTASWAKDIFDVAKCLFEIAPTNKLASGMCSFHHEYPRRVWICSYIEEGMTTEQIKADHAAIVKALNMLAIGNEQRIETINNRALPDRVRAQLLDATRAAYIARASAP